MKRKGRRRVGALDAKAIRNGVAKRLRKYKGLNLLERFAMFMAMAQVLESSLKLLLVRRYNYDFEKIGRWTLGTVARELESSGLRQDFIGFIKSVVKYRNHIAHGLLANEIMLRAILGGRAGWLELRHLEKGIYELEQILFLYEWTENNRAWGRKRPGGRVARAPSAATIGPSSATAASYGDAAPNASAASG